MKNIVLPLTAIILTYNEQKNLPSCLESIKDFVSEIILIDSFSTDKTLEIAARYTNRIYRHKFVNQAQQFEWALKNINISNEWVLRIDADERWSLDGFNELRDIIQKDVADGINVIMKYYFMGRWIKHGDFYPNYFLRVYKKSKGRIEDRLMDEHICVNGRTVTSNIEVIECNYDRQTNISGWISKHNDYATREAVEYIISKYHLREVDSIADFFGNKTERKRWLKENIYYKMPLFVRPFLYFVYRYFIKLGFLDGKEGFIFHVHQAFWYRFLVDSIIYQLEHIANKEKRNMSDVIKEKYGIGA